MLSTRNDRLECPKELLIGLVRTVEFIIDVSVFKQSIFHLSSCRNHLHARIKAILKHGTKIKHHLIYSQPTFADFDVWLEESLINFSLVTTLQTKRHDLEDLYYEWAFLRNQYLFDAFIDILHVLSTRDATPLLKIMAMEANLKLDTVQKSQAQAMPLSGDPLLASLLGTDYTSTEIMTASSPVKVVSSRAINIPLKKDVRLTQTADEAHSSQSKSEYSHRQETTVDPINVNLEANIPSFSYSYQSPVSSPPLDRVHPESLPASGLSVPKASSLLNLPITKTSSENESVSRYGSVRVMSTGTLYRQKSSSEEEKLYKKKSGWNESFLESGGMVLPPAMGHFPTPQQGQTLTSFLSSLSDNLPDLDRENAHFNVSEALISAFERIKIQKYQEKLKAQQSNVESDDEDVFGTVKRSSNVVPASEGERAQGVSKSPMRFRGGRKNDPSSFTETEESELEYWRQQPRKPPPYLRKKPRPCVQSDGQGVASRTSSSFTSSEEDFLSSYSAENVALNLLRNSKVTDKQLPPASELQWLVSELEAPQALLPLPKAKSASENESDYNSGSATDCSIGRIDNHIRLRGNLDWAPPRPQIIFTVHPPPSINILTKTQRCRCAGCGTKVDMKYVSTFRYCYYLGRYFCTGCHTGKRARLPQMIIHQWDFSPHPVSNFAATLLEKLQSDPVYNILAINKTIYKKVKLNNFRNYRIQLGILKEYIQNCRSSNFLQGELNKFPQYYSCDVDLYSLEDLVHLRFSTGLPMKSKEFVTEAIKHVLNCELCKELGFICEMCNRTEILFPFQINRVTRCSQCASCFHLKCFNPGRNSCPKCLRISARKSNHDVHTAIVPDTTEPVTDGLDVAC